MRGPIPQGEGEIFGVNEAAHCKVIGHSTVRCAKTAEPIDMPVWLKTRVGPRNHVLDGRVQIPKGEGAIFGGCPDHSKTLEIFAAPVAAASLQKGSFNRQ